MAVFSNIRVCTSMKLYEKIELAVAYCEPTKRTYGVNCKKKKKNEQPDVSYPAESFQ